MDYEIFKVRKIVIVYTNTKIDLFKLSSMLKPSDFSKSNELLYRDANTGICAAISSKGIIKFLFADDKGYESVKRKIIRCIEKIYKIKSLREQIVNIFIRGKYKIKTKLPLFKIYKKLRETNYFVYYDPLYFPGMVIKKEGMSLTLFSNGAFIAVGGKDVDKLKKYITEVGNIIESMTSS